MNEGLIRGTIRRIEIERNYTSITVITDGSGKSVKLKLRAFKQSLTEGFMPHDRVEIRFHIENRRIDVAPESDSGQFEYSQVMVIDSMSLAKRRLYYLAPEYDIEDNFTGGVMDDENMVKVAGTMHRVVSSNDTSCNIIFVSKSSGAVDYIKATLFGKERDRAMELKKGDEVIMVGSMINGTKRKDGTVTDMFYCRDIARIVPAEEKQQS